MFRELPSLTGLRAFESAARLGSLKAAADELGVTPAAVGAQVQALEQWLGQDLFVRKHRKIKPTAAALRLQNTCNRALAELSKGVREVSVDRRENVLTVGVGTLFASRWLSPRLSEFWQACPDVALRLIHTPDLSRPAALEADAVVAWGRGDWPGVDKSLIFRPHLVPIASPGYLVANGRPSTPQDLLSHNLVEEFGTLWADWFKEQGLEPLAPKSTTIVRDGVLALQLALDGQAVALGVEEFLAADFSSGNLEPLFKPRTSQDDAYYLLTPTHSRASEALTAFRSWIELETAERLEGHPTMLG